MEVKVSTIDRLSKSAPTKMVSEFLNKSTIHVTTGCEVDLNHLKIGESCMVVGIDSDPYGKMYLNHYKRVKD